ncbi:unnamed protein product [Ectocarpus sp. CCAP 1310/34]|nr:unnamed protein product [Ectocarpus sp. CCAP 1310/34]
MAAVATAAAISMCFIEAEEHQQVRCNSSAVCSGSQRKPDALAAAKWLLAASLWAHRVLSRRRCERVDSAVALHRNAAANNHALSRTAPRRIFSTPLPATVPPPAASPPPLPPRASRLLARPSPLPLCSPGQPPPRPYPAMPPITAHAIRQLGPGKKTEGLQDSRLHGHTRSDARHSTGFISTLGRNTRVSTLEARSAVDGERKELGGAAAAEEKAGFIAAVDPGGVGGADTPYPFATLLANREVMDATLHDQRPPDQLPELPGNEASDLRFPKRFNKAMASERRHLWSDSMIFFFYGLLDADIHFGKKAISATHDQCQRWVTIGRKMDLKAH